MENVTLQLWAKLIHNDHHDDYDTPPNIPLITGKDEEEHTNIQNICGHKSETM